MTAPKVGDRVRAEFEGVVARRLSNGRLSIMVEEHEPAGLLGHVAVAWPEHVTVIAPPVRVGDVATLDVLNSLPSGSVVIAKGGLVAQVFTGDDGAREWRTTYRNAGPILPSNITYWPATVLHIGGSK